MKKLIILSLFVLFLIQTTYAQTKTKYGNTSVVLTEEAEVNLKQIAKNIGFRGSLVMSLQELMGKAATVAVIKQKGSHNDALIMQDGTNQFAYILQNGSYLDASLRVDGSDNNAIVKQRGDHLGTNVLLKGNNNDFKLLQKGSYLKNSIKLLGVSDMNLFFLQTERGFFYTQNGGGLGIPMKIKSTQQVPAIIVRNNYN